MAGSHSRRIVVAVIVSLVGCGHNDKNLGQNAACTSSDDCAVDLVCDSGHCRTACNLDIDCPVGNHCAYGVCVPLPKGVCAQAGDCITPPDSCHIIAGATCNAGTCTYPSRNTPSCGPPCTTTAECDPLTHGLDRCSTGTCLNGVCSFAPIAGCSYGPLTSICGSDTDCASGHCANGICCDSACDGVCEDCTRSTGHCDTTPLDDTACGTIYCTALSSACRTYQDLTNATGRRCAAFGSCAQSNSPSGCVVFADAPNTQVCRPSTGPCDVADNCANGACGSDALVAAGEHCVGHAGQDDPGVCDDTHVCWQLSTLGAGERYFLEEASTTAARIDAFGNANLVVSGTGSDVSTEQDTTGHGLMWDATNAATTYCVAGLSTVLASSPKTATLEIDMTASLGTYGDELIAGAFTTSTLFGLSIAHTSGDPTATLRAWANGASATFLIDPSPARLVLHLVFDSTQSNPNNRFRIYVNGTHVTGSSPVSMNDVLNGTAAQFCVGNGDSPEFASTGTIWYAALYNGVPTTTQIQAAMVRLDISDAP